MLKHPLRGERGQTSLFMALFISTMILLFAFTTNIGMLVHAKINLQNAADAAAYAGAAVQARQLTSVAYLNYEMRRAVKEFLFYYTVRGQYAALPCFPMDSSGSLNPFANCPGGGGDARYNFQIYDHREAINETGGNYLPTVCIIFDKDNNYCQKKGVAGIPEFPSGGGWGVADPIVDSVRNATNQIINKKLEDCLSRTDINRKFIAAWMFNLYPIQDSLSMLRTGQDADDPFPFSNGLERVGILPRMAVLRARIDNFEEMLNLNLAMEGSSLTINAGAIDTFKSLVSENKKMEYYERPIQAFLSAKNNLVNTGGDHGVFDEIELSELLPTSAGPAASTNLDTRNPPTLVRFNELVAPVTLANSKFETMNDGSQDRGNCRQFRELRVIPRFPFGVTKDPAILTYYAVRLQAQARLLFSPFGKGPVTLSAYAAAKPFGSRVGKDLLTNFPHLVTAEGALDIGPNLFPASFPNPLVSEDDADSAIGGFTRASHLGYLRQAMAYTGRLDHGARLAGAYAPWEVGYYTVPANFQTPDNIGLFEDNPVYSGKYFSMSARLLPVNKAVSDPSFLNSIVAGYLVGDITQRDTLERGPFAPILQAALGPDKWIALYTFMKDTHGLERHFIPDPLLNDEPELLSFVKAIGGRFTVAGMSQPQRRQLTSWNNQKSALDADLDIPSNSELGLDIGRSGYSVKFMSFSNLQAGGRATNDPALIGQQWANPLTRSSINTYPVPDDIRKLKH